MKMENESQILPRLFDKALRNYIYLKLYTIHDEHTHVYDAHTIHICIYTLKKLKPTWANSAPYKNYNKKPSTRHEKSPFVWLVKIY